MDDWSNLDNAPAALDELSRLSYDPAEVHDTRRYRPSYTAVWNSLQWHTFGAPDNMTGPNFWAVVRLALAAGGLVLLTAVSVAIAARRRPAPAALAVWAAVPAVLLLTTPQLTIDLARQGPVEPLMLGGMALGGMLTLFGLRRYLAANKQRRRTVVAVVAMLAGYVLWLFGVYQKEASICALILLVPLYFVLDRRWRSQGVIDGPLHQHWSFRIVAVALVVPLLHMLYEISAVTKGGETVYGADVPSGLSGWVSRLWDSASMQWNATSPLDLTLWIALAAATPWLVLAWILQHRKIPLFALGLIVTALAVYLFQGLANVAVSRYFIPVVALVAVAAVVLLVDGPRWLRVIALAGAVVFVVQGLDTRDFVHDWADYQKTRLAAVTDVAKFNPDRCPVYMGTMHAEDADAFPVLVDLESRPSNVPCTGHFAGYMIEGHEAGPSVTNQEIFKVCAPPGWLPLRSPEALDFYGCRKFRSGYADRQEVADVLRWNRLVPGQRLSERVHSFPDQALCEAPECMALLADLRKTYR